MLKIIRKPSILEILKSERKMMNKILFITLIIMSFVFSERKGIGWNGDILYKQYLNKIISFEISFDPGFSTMTSFGNRKEENKRTSVNLGAKFLLDKKYNEYLLLSPFIETYYEFSNHKVENCVDISYTNNQKYHRITIGFGFHPSFVIKEHLILRTKFGFKGIYNYTEIETINNPKSSNSSNREIFDFRFYGEKISTTAGFEFIWIF